MLFTVYYAGSALEWRVHVYSTMHRHDSLTATGMLHIHTILTCVHYATNLRMFYLYICADSVSGRRSEYRPAASTLGAR